MIVAAFVAFAPAIRAPFAFDDVESIPGNPTIEHVFPLSTSLNPPARLAVSGRPVVNLSLAIDRALSASLGLDQPDAESRTLVYHVTNVLLHVLCGLLLFGVVRRTMSLATLGAWANANAETVALVSTAFWLVHPIQSEAVDYVIQRTELLVSACYLATLYASIRAWDASTARRRTAWMVGGVAVCAVGMASKEVMVTAPFVVAMYDRVFRVSSWRELANDRARRWFYGGTCRNAGAPGRPDRRRRTRRLGGIRARASLVSLPLQPGLGDRALSPIARLADRSPLRLRLGAGGRHSRGSSAV